MIDRLFACPEKRGARLRHVREVPPSLGLEAYLKHRIPPEYSPMKDLTMIWTPGVRVLLVDSIGAMFKGPLEFQGLPDVHMVFWDKILRGREYMARGIAAELTEDAGSRGVFTAIPETAAATVAFAKRVGFEVVRETSGVLLLTLLFT